MVVVYMLFPLHGWRDVIYLAAMTVAAIFPPALISLHAGRFRRLPGCSWMAMAAVNLAALLLFLEFYGAYNCILLFGAYSIFASRFYLLLHTYRERRFGPVAAGINMLIVVAIAFAVPHVNGIRLTMTHLWQPTHMGLHMGLYEREADGYRGSLRTEYFYRVDREAPDQPRRVLLALPEATHAAGEIALLIRPLTPARFRIAQIDLVNRLGFESRNIESFDRERMASITEFDGEASSRLSKADHGLAIGPVEDHIWLTVPVDTGYAERARSPAGRGNALRALLYWQITWFLCVTLAPFARPPRPAAAS